MANKRGGRTIRLEIPPETEGKTEGENGVDQELKQAAEEFGSGSFIIVSRLDPVTAQYAYLDRMAGTEADTNMLARRYGGGTYKLQFRGPDEKGRSVQKQQRIVQVDSSIPPKSPPGLGSVDNKRLRYGPMDPGDDGDVGMDSILKTGVLRLFNGYENLLARREGGDGQSSNNEMIQLLIAMMNNNSQMMMAMMQSQSQQMTTLMTSIMSGKPELQEQLALITALKDGSGEKQSFKEMLESFQMLRRIAGDVAPDDSWPGLIREFAPPVIDAITHAKEVDSRAVVTQPVRQVAAVTPTPPQPQEPSMLWKVAVKSQLPFLLKQAQADRDPELYAELACDQIPESFTGALRVACKSDTFVADTLAAFPETQPYRDWFTKLLSTIRSITLDASRPEVDDTDDLLDDTVTSDDSKASESATAGRQGNETDASQDA